jgi:hypothetical protein
MPTNVHQVDLPPAARALSTLPSVDYTDAFVVETGQAQDRTGEQCARAMLGTLPAATRATLSRGWFALGLKLGPAGSDRHVLGWEVRRSNRDFALLGAGSRIGMPAELLFQPHEQGFLFATLLRHENLFARALWAGVAPAHRKIVRQILERHGLG